MPATTFTVARTNPRFSFIAEAELAELVDGPRIVARISELSSRGCYVDTFNPFPVGGNVIYTHTNYGMGLRFGETSAENRATLDAWLEELARKSA